MPNENIEIDKAWRNFLNGSSVLLLRGIIQDTLESFFSFVVKEGLSSQDPSTVPAYRAAQETQDLQRLSAVYSQEFHFKYKGKPFMAKLPSFSTSLRLAMGNRDYNLRLDSQERIVIYAKSFTDFFVSARQLGFYRNDDAHKKYKINDTGHALGVASTALKIVELSPIEIRNQESLISLKDNLGSLLRGVLKKEDPTTNILEDELEEDKVKEQEHGAIENASALESKKLESIIEFIEESKDDVLEKANKLENLIGKINENVLNIQKEYKEEKNESLEKNDVPVMSNFEEPEIDTLETNSEEVIEVNYNKNESPAINEEFESPLTPQQALYEMLLLQKAIKKKFKCKNWENLAQGPIRETIVKEKIKTKEDFLKNQFIQNRYFENKYIMDEIIESKLGKEFFSVLSRII